MSAMKHYPCTRPVARLHGLEVCRTYRNELPLSACGRLVWFCLGFFTAGTVAGFLSGLLP